MSRRPVANPGVATRSDRDPGAAEQLHEPGRDSAFGHRPHMAAEAPVGAGAEEVVEQPEEGEAEHAEQHFAARRA